MTRTVLVVAVLAVFCLAAVPGKAGPLSADEALKVLKQAAEKRGDTKRELDVLWVHNGTDDAIARIRDNGELLLVKMVQEKKKWRLAAVETRTGHWLPVKGK